MKHGTPSGPALTCKGDRRITTTGRFLRAWKLDELPQLINVLRGDMSMVGPRPDSAEFLQVLPPVLGGVLALRPGITGKASLQFRNEEEILGRVPVSELTSYYKTVLLPLKIRIDLEYAHDASLLRDVKLLMKTASAILCNSDGTSR
jgi:lipopolysaccharide/colanic/teichoic acid biosynthesis glycosyltransferase